MDSSGITMLDTVRAVSRSWWVLLVEGVLGVLFGVLAIVWPGKTLAVLIALFGLFALTVGIVRVISAIGAAASHQSWGGTLAVGILGIIAGLLILRWPGITALYVLLLIGFWAIVTGVFQIVEATIHHDEIRHGWLYALNGLVSVLFGILMFVWPGIGLLTVVYLVGLYAIVYGIIACMLAFRVRSLPEQLEARYAPTSPTPSY